MVLKLVLLILVCVALSINLVPLTEGEVDLGVILSSIGYIALAFLIKEMGV